MTCPICHDTGYYIDDEPAPGRTVYAICDCDHAERNAVVVTEVRAIDLGATSPMEALTKLHELQRLAGGPK